MSLISSRPFFHIYFLGGILSTRAKVHPEPQFNGQHGNGKEETTPNLSLAIWASILIGVVAVF